MNKFKISDTIRCKIGHTLGATKYNANGERTITTIREIRGNSFRYNYEESHDYTRESCLYSFDDIELVTPFEVGLDFDIY